MNNDRPSRDEVLMSTALLWSERSTCSRAQVGCVVSRDGRSLSTGYNGAPANMPHCDHSCDCGESVPGNAWPKSQPHQSFCRAQTPCTNVIHAEANAITFAARYGVGTDGAEIHTTRVPCMTCAGLIINAGITRVVWVEEHRDMTGWERLAKAGVDVVRWGS